MFFNKKISLIFFLMFFFIAGGCASKMQVNVDGRPMPDSTVVVKNHETGIRVEGYMARMVQKNNGDESELYPADYLDFENEKPYELDSDTVAVAGKFRVVNPNNKTYFLKVVYTLNYPGEKFPYITSHVLYEGSAREKTFNINRKAENSRPEVEVRLLVEKGEVSDNKNSKEPSVFGIPISYQVED